MINRRYRAKKDLPAPVYGVRRNAELTGWRLDLFTDNHRLAFAVIKSFRTRLRCLGIDRDDAGQVAMCGLWGAAAAFDPDNGAQFSTFATHCVKMALLELVNTTQRDRDRWAGIQFHGSDTPTASNVAAPRETPAEPDWIDDVPPKIQAVVRRRLAGATWAEVATEFGYACDATARTVAKKYYNERRAS